jgi:heme exporter protein CcmD
LNWQNLMSLEGHGPYILGAYAAGAVMVGVELFLVLRRLRLARRAALQALHDEDTLL